MKQKWVLAVLLTIWVPVISANDQFIMIGAYPISLGMDREEALNQLNDLYELECTSYPELGINNEDCSSSVTVKVRGRTSEILGRIRFSDDRVERVERSWKGFESEASVDFVNTLFRMFQTMKEEGHEITGYSITDVPRLQGEDWGEERTVYLDFGNKKEVYISFKNTAHGVWVEIVEMMDRRPRPPSIDEY